MMAYRADCASLSAHYPPVTRRTQWRTIGNYCDGSGGHSGGLSGIIAMEAADTVAGACYFLMWIIGEASLGRVAVCALRVATEVLVAAALRDGASKEAKVS